MTRPFAWALAAGAVFLFGATTMATAAELKVGDPAPNFSLVGSDGQTHKLEDLKGKTVVLAWFPRAFTGGCTKECKSFAEDGKLMKEFNVAYFTASTDPAEKNKAFAKSLSADYPILSDPTDEAAKAYGVVPADAKEGAAAKRTTFIIGADGKILFIDSKVKTETHGRDVAAKLKELGVK
ncbi:MAG TPA: peroxiredoxin [Pirellulales bacterium]|jgi:peroxiredoxin Q/BCP|nr:peroxiredoxin [Pirellulales bacterium]